MFNALWSVRIRAEKFVVMDASSIITSVLGLAALGVVWWLSPDAAVSGLKSTSSIAWDAALRMVPGFLLAGLAIAIAPREMISNWMGQESGLKGIMVGTVLGAAMPGVTGVQLPLIVAMAKIGVGVGPLVAYFSAWAILGINRLIVWEIPFLGARLALLRFGVSIAFPVIAGWACSSLYKQ